MPTDRYQQFTQLPFASQLVDRLGLPKPPRLERYDAGGPVITGQVLFGAAPGGRLAGPVTRVLAHINAETHTPMEPPELRRAAADADLDAKVWGPNSEERFKALVFDASGI